MKKFLCLFFATLIMLLLYTNVSAKAVPDAKTVSETIQKVCPDHFGYVDNSEYYMSSYFSGLEDVDDFHIVTCADSTNFSEIGVFHMKNNDHQAENKKLLKRYLQKIKQNFENGVVYNADEYPKFENARVISVGNYLIYTVLDRHHVLRAEKAVRDMIPS